MIKVVCNASPIIGLSIIGKLDLLHEVFEEVIIDDKLARNFAETMLLKTTGIIGILLIAKRLDKITNIKQYLDVLIQEGYRISKKLYLAALESAGESE